MNFTCVLLLSNTMAKNNQQECLSPCRALGTVTLGEPGPKSAQKEGQKPCRLNRNTRLGRRGDHQKESWKEYLLIYFHYYLTWAPKTFYGRKLQVRSTPAQSRQHDHKHWNRIIFCSITDVSHHN